MDTIFLLLFLVVAAIIANLIHYRLTRIPVAFLQIDMGLLLALLPVYHNFHLEPEIFMFAIISVLMFNDGQNTSPGRLTRQAGTTFSLAIGLAIVSIIIIGAVTHLLLPSLSLALALALGAIITPTDAVAVSSITSNMLVPTDVMHTLENESLFKDASGIVALNLAIATVATGQFSVWHGIGNFFYVFFGGLLVGFILGAIIVSLRLRLIKLNVDAPSIIVPITLLTPFAVYFVAESINVSGILAVVVTGLLHGIQQNRLRLTSSRLQIVLTSTWSVVASLLNGIVFVLLGLSLPQVAADLHRQSGGTTLPILLGLALSLYAVMTLLRFLWTRFNLAQVFATSQAERNKKSLIIALSGVHGTITLAMALSLPLTLNGHAVSFRNDMIFMASIVILISLLVPTLLLPLLLPQRQSTFTNAELAAAKNAMVNDAIQMIASQHSDSVNASRVVNVLDGQPVADPQVNRTQLAQLFDHCFDLEHDIVTKMLQHQQVSLEIAQLYMRAAENTLVRYQKNGWQRSLLFLRFNLVKTFSLTSASRKRRQAIRQQRDNWRSLSHEEAVAKKQHTHQQLCLIDQQTYPAVIDYLNEQLTYAHTREVAIVRTAYDQRHRQLVGEQDFIDEQNTLLIAAFQQEYNYIQDQITTKNINRELGQALNEQVSTDRLAYLQSIDTD